MKEALIDTDILSYYFRGDPTVTNRFALYQDLLIAGIALEHNLVMVTNNERHFSRIPNLIIDNWKKI